MTSTGKLTLKFKTNYSHITTDKNDNGKYECERCQIEFNDPSEVFWAEVGDYSKKHGVPLCVDCCEDQMENWADEEEEEDEEHEKLKREAIARLKAAGPRTQEQADAAEARRNGDE
jgi:hypothetical protein